MYIILKCVTCVLCICIYFCEIHYYNSIVSLYFVSILKVNICIITSRQNLQFTVAGNTALHNAVIHNRCATAICLLNHGAEHGVANNAGQSPLYMALLHKCRAVARLLHATGGKLTAREVDMYQTYEARRYEEKQDFLDWALHEFNTPPSLGNICRVVIRHCLAKSKCLGKTVEVLPLPPAMKKFVLFSDFYSDSESINDSNGCT